MNPNRTIQEIKDTARIEGADTIVEDTCSHHSAEFLVWSNFVAHKEPGGCRDWQMVSKRLGLLIATTDYADPQLPAAPDGAANLNDLADVLQSPKIGGFSLTVLIDPTVETARSAIVNLLASREHDDLVLVYIVGHCIRQTDDTLFLALQQTTRSDLENTALSATLVRQQLQQTAAKKQIIILDCLLGSVVSTEVPVDRDSPLNVGLNFCVPNRQQAMLAASDYLSFCLPGEYYVALRSAQLPLAESIVRGLRSRAAGEKGDRQVTVNGLLNYLKYIGSVRKDEMRVGWMSEGAEDLLIAVYPDKEIDQINERPTAKPGTPASARAAGSSLLDDSANFTAYRPAILIPGKWCPMIVFTHSDEAATLLEIEARTQQILGAEYDDYRDVVDSRFPIVRESEITLVPEVPGIRFNPTRRSFSWASDVRMREESFFMRAPVALAGKLARGRISVFFGPLLWAEIALNLGVGKDDPAPKEESWAKAVGKRFRKVFVSYSNQDAMLVEPMQRQIRTAGYDYLREVVKLRSIQPGNERLMAMIADADIFQLFWSRNAAQSAHVEKEWCRAVAIERQTFVRPVYWEIPMPEAPEPLGRLRFCFLPSIHRMIDRPKEKDAERDGSPVEDSRVSTGKPAILPGVPPSAASAAAKSQASSTEQTRGTSPSSSPDKTSFGETSDWPPPKTASMTRPEETPTDLSSVAVPTKTAKTRRRMILGWTAIVGTVIGGCLFAFLPFNLFNRTFLQARQPFTHSEAAPSPTPGIQPTPSALVETPILTTPTPSPTQPPETPAPLPTVEQPSASSSVAPASTASREETDSDSPTNRARHHLRHRPRHRHS